MNKDEAFEKLHDVLELKVRKATQPRITAEGRKLFLCPSRNAQMLELSATGVEDLMKSTGLTRELARKITPAMFAAVATEAMSNCSLLLRNDFVVNIGGFGGHAFIDTRRVFDTLDKAIPGVDFHRILTLPNHTVQIETVGVDEKPVTRGDLVKAGALVRYSPLGTVKPTVQTYVLRLACTNGLTTNDIIKEFTFTGDGGRIWPWLRQSSRAAYNALGKVVERFQAMRAQQISPGDRASILALLLRRGQIHGAAAEVIRAEALAHPPETSYDMMNLIGWASSHIITDAKTVARVHDSMTDFVAQAEHARLCPACHRLI